MEALEHLLGGAGDLLLGADDGDAALRVLADGEHLPLRRVEQVADLLVVNLHVRGAWASVNASAHAHTQNRGWKECGAHG